MQRALIQYRNPKNYDLVHEALTKAGRTDLIGFGPKCLIRPRKEERSRMGGRDGSGRKTAERSGQTGKDIRMAGKRRQPGSGRTETDRREARQPETRRKKTIRNVHKKKTGED